MSELKMSDVLMSAVELVISRSGDIDLEDGSFATCGTDEIIRLGAAIASFLELPSDDVDIRDIDLILRKAKSYDASQELIKKLTEQLDTAEHNCTLRGNHNVSIRAENSKLTAENKRLREALTGVVDMYCCLINSGDAGNWNPEEDDEIIAARKALSQEGE